MKLYTMKGMYLGEPTDYNGFAVWLLDIGPKWPNNQSLQFYFNQIDGQWSLSYQTTQWTEQW